MTTSAKKGLMLAAAFASGILGAGSLLYAQQSDLDSALLIVELNRLATSPNLTAIPLFTLAGVVLVVSFGWESGDAS